MSIEIPLIREIKKHQCLYDFNLPEYNRKDILDAAWAEVAANCGLTVTECKDKWKNIRSSFVRSLRPSSSKWKKPYYLSSYLKFIIPFLKPLGIIEVTPDDSQQAGAEEDFNEYGNNTDTDVEVPIASIKIESLTDYENDEMIFDDQDDVNDLLSNQSMSEKRRHTDGKNPDLPKNKKRKSNSTNARTDKDSAMRYFLLSLLPDFETMNEDQIRMFKMKTIMLIDDIKTTDIKQLKTQNSDSTNSNNGERLQKRLINLLIRNIKREK